MSSPAVRFSVVTPTHRRPQSLLRMLDALARQDYPFALFEVIVVVDGPDEGLIQNLAIRSYPYRIRAVSQSRSGPAVARNRGLEEAAETHVLFLDDHVIPATTFVRRHDEPHENNELVVI